MAKRVVWKEGDVVSIKLREDLFTVGQMARNPYLAFFNIKSVDDHFGELDLGQTPMFFVIPVARDFLQRRIEGKIKKGVAARAEIVMPRIWIDPRTAYGEKFMWKGGDLVEIDPKVGNQGMNNRIVELDFHPKNERELNQYEVTNIRTDEGLVRRLIVCLELGKNVDPFKEKMLTGKDPYGVYD